MKKVLLLVAVLAIGVGTSYAQQIGLDNAIRNAAWGLSSGVERGSSVAVLSMHAGSARMSDYLINETIVALMGVQAMQGFTVMSRLQLDQAMAGLPFHTSDWIDNTAAQSIGRSMGVQFVVTGTLESIAGFFRLRMQVIDVESGGVRGIHTADVQNDTLVAYLMGTGTPLQMVAAPAVATQQQLIDAHEVENARVNWLSFGLGGRIGGFLLSVNYDRDIGRFFSLGGSAALVLGQNFSFDGSFRAQLFIGGSPFYLGLGAGVGMFSFDRWVPVYSTTPTWVSDGWGGGFWQETRTRTGTRNERNSSFAFAVTPAIGLRLGGRTQGFFMSPFLNLPIAFNESETSVSFGTTVGRAW